MWNDSVEGHGMDTGGGYMNSPGYGGTQQAQAKEKRGQNVFPCTIAQIVQAENLNDNIIYNGVVLNQITIVGLVKAIRAGNPFTAYDIDDMSGNVVEVRQFIDPENEPSSEAMSVRENVYVRVFGNIRSFNGKRNIVAFKIRPILDISELTTHLLELLYVRAHSKKMNAKESISVSHTGHNLYSSNPAFSSNDVGMSHLAMNSGMNDIQQKVLNVFRACNDDSGVHIQNVSNHLKGIPMKTIRETVDFLAGEGHIFSTIDDNHFKAIDSDY